MAPSIRIPATTLFVPLLVLLPVLLLSGDAAPGPVPAWADLSTNQRLVGAMLLLFAGGMLSGLLAGLLGIGGALVTIPALHVALPALGIRPVDTSATAVATALLAMVPITLLAALRQRRHGALELGWLRRMAVPTAVGAAAGALLAAALNGPVLALLFALQSSWYGASLLARRCGGGAGRDETGPWRHVARLPPWAAVPPMAAFCACVGMGGGSLITPFLLRRQVPFRHAVATAGALNLCIAVAGSAAFVIAGGRAAGTGACLPAAVLLAGGAMLSVHWGVSLAHRVPAALLQRMVGGVNLVSALTLVCQLLP